jgi:hypothetical protein
VTGVKGATLKGQHVEVSGYTNPTTLEVFTYANAISGEAKVINETGIAHVCFKVEDLDEILKRALSAGGKAVGEAIPILFHSWKIR